MLLQGTRDGWPGPLKTFFNRPSSDPAQEDAPAPLRCRRSRRARAAAAALQQPERAESLGSVQAVIIAECRAGLCPAGHCTVQQLNA